MFVAGGKIIRNDIALLSKNDKSFMRRREK
jgi:hypothetical protein